MGYLNTYIHIVAILKTNTESLQPFAVIALFRGDPIFYIVLIVDTFYKF